MTKEREAEKIQELLTRGVEAIYPSSNFLKSKLEKRERLRIYMGIDPTGPTLHLGHAIVLKKLSEFQEAGCEVILLIGDFTAMIGDPTGKKSARVALSREKVLNNAKLYKEQASVFLNFEGKNPAKLKYNSEWLSKMNFENVLELASKMTVSQMLERDMFENREEEGRPIFLHEFLYPLMQGYDSVAMDVDGEVGGNDQTFNMLVGRDLLKEIRSKEKFVLTMKLLTDKAGVKMGKTEGNMLSLVDDSNMMFGKVMSWEDGMILGGFELCTNIPVEEIHGIKKEMSCGGNPRDAKIRLAREIVRIYHGEEKAKKAEEDFIKTFQKKETPDDMIEVKSKKGVLLSEVLVGAKFLKSKSEFGRLVEEGAISVNGERVGDIHVRVEELPAAVKIGKKRFLRLV